MKRALVACFAALLLAGCGSAAPHAVVHDRDVPGGIPEPLPYVAPPPPVPVHITIPAANVDAAVEAVGTNAQGAMGTPAQTQDTAWYDGGPAPGQVGDAVIDGHLDWYTGPAVFWALGSVTAGSTIAVTMSDGSVENFVVTTTAQYPYTATVPGLFATTGGPELSLITCAGSWDGAIYSDRLVVTAVPA